MKPLQHARASVRRYGGRIEDYMDIHTFIDSPKSGFADVRHRAILHNAWGCFVVETAFGDHVQVTCTANGIEVDEYSHD